MATYTGIVESNAVQAREQTFAGPPRRLLLAVKPSCQGDYKEVERL